LDKFGIEFLVTFNFLMREQKIHHTHHHSTHFVKLQIRWCMVPRLVIKTRNLACPTGVWKTSRHSPMRNHCPLITAKYLLARIWPATLTSHIPFIVWGQKLLAISLHV
jgi:hypothetical protein